MRRTLCLTLACALFVQGAFGQTAPTPPQAKVQDVATMEAILHTLYDVISAGPNDKRDWDRFRTLFVPSARLGAADVPQRGFNPAALVPLLGVVPLIPGIGGSRGGGMIRGGRGLLNR